MIHDLGEFDGICGLVSLIVAVATCRSNFTPTGAWDKIRHTKAGWFARWQNFVDAPQKMTQTQTFWWTSPFFMVNSYTHPVDWKLCFFFKIFPNFSGNSLKFPYSISGWSYFARSFLWSMAIFTSQFLPGQYRGWQPVATLVQREWWIFTRPHNWSFQWETLEF